MLVPALPRWKLFIFGGSTGQFNEGDPRNFGNHTNSLIYMDINEDLNKSNILTLNLENEKFVPLSRENSTFIYDSVEQRLILFGGWSNLFHKDLCQLNVSAITGPEYAIYDIKPKLGPYTGNTKCVIKGEGFKST